MPFWKRAKEALASLVACKNAAQRYSRSSQKDLQRAERIKQIINRQTLPEWATTHRHQDIAVNAFGHSPAPFQTAKNTTLWTSKTQR